MVVIGRLLDSLELSRNDFAVEALASTIRPEWIQTVLTAHGRTSRRIRQLPAPFVVWFVVLLGLFRRTSYDNLVEKVHGGWWAGYHWPADSRPCSSAVTKARDRVGVEPLRDLFTISARAWREQTAGRLFHGRRVSAIDGSTLKTPDSKANRRYFGKPGASRGKASYPQVRLVGLLDVGTHLFTAVRFGPYAVGEMTLARQLVASVDDDAIVILDRNFGAYDFLWDLSKSAGSDFLLRLRSCTKPREITVVAEGDRIVEVDIPRHVRRHRPDIPETWRLREITYTPPAGQEEIRLLTTVLDTAVSAQELAELYHERWEEEGAFDEVKTHLCDCTQVNRPVVFRSKTPKRVEQELYGLFIAHNAVRMTMTYAAALLPICCLRLSYTAAIERLRETSHDMMRMRTTLLPERYEEMLKALSRSKVPRRPDRHEPRAVKMKMSRYPLKRTG